MNHCSVCLFFFFFNDTATTEIYTLSLHDALPISVEARRARHVAADHGDRAARGREPGIGGRSEEHTSELQSRLHLVCRLLLEKKKKLQYEIGRQMTQVSHGFTCTITSSATSLTVC